MANTFKNAITADIGTTDTTIYTAPASTTSTIIGLTLANLLSGNNNITVTVKLIDNSAGTEVHLVKDAPVPVGGSLVVVGGNQKVILETGDSLEVTSSAATSCDATVSMLEISS